MKAAIITRKVSGKNFNFKKNERVYLAQHNPGTTLVRIVHDSNIEYPVPHDAVKVLPENIKVDIHVERLPRRNDSMFYYDKHIATITKGHTKVIVESAGEMRAFFDEKGDCYQNDMLAKELESRGTTDRSLSTLGKNDQIQMNNWFRLWVTENDVFVNNDEITHTYDDAIKMGKEFIKNYKL
jgi:hypothetical protein